MRKITVFICIFFISLSIYPQSLRLKLDRINYHLANYTIIHPSYTKIWSRNEAVPIDSILYELRIQSDYYYVHQYRAGKINADKFDNFIKRNKIDINKLNCQDLPSGLNILVKKELDSTKICLYKRYNSYLTDEIILSYHSDSLKLWNDKNIQSDMIKSTSINYPFCIDNNIKMENIELHFIPYSTGFIYNDPRIQDLQLSVSTSKLRAGTFKGYTFFVKKEDYHVSDSKSISVDIYDNEHKKLHSRDFRFKNNFQIGDSIFLDGSTYKLDSINKTWIYLYLSKLENLNKEIYLPYDILERLTPYFDNHSYLLIDFWGTWCNPCIKGLPKLRSFHNTIKNKCSFLSICVDQAKNFDQAKKILKEEKIQWEQIFEDQFNTESSLSEKLNISTFPTYILIDNKGEILFRDCNLDFEKVNNLLKTN